MVWDMKVDPYAVFPKELWEMILDLLMRENPAENSKDVLNLMHAYPVFVRDFASLKEDCLIMQVLSFLVKKAYLNKIVKCRLYNKTWCRVVDAYLNCQSRKTVDDFLIDNSCTNYGQWEGTKIVVNFMRFMKEHPASRNPFVVNKRLIKITATPSLIADEAESEAEEDEDNARDWEPDCRAQEKFMEEVIKMLEKYGQHIWNLQFDYDCSFFGVYNQPLLWANISKILKLVPNLKYLRLTNSSDTNEFDDLRKPPESAFECLQISLPDLPRLEELYVSFCPYTTCQSEANLWSKLVQRYASTVELLRLEAMWGANDDDDVFKFVEIPSASAVSFPLLKKLTYDDGACDKKSMSYFFNQLFTWIAPNLEKFVAVSQCEWIRYEKDPVNSEITSGNDWKQILQKLKRFPALKRFKTNYCISGGEEDLVVEEDAHLSLEELHLSDYQNVTYRMLLCFPNLIHLKIQSDRFPIVQDFSINSEVKIREELQTGQMFKSNIWQLFSNLKTFTLLSAPTDSLDAIIIYLANPFTRENYEKFNKKAIFKDGEGDNRLDFDTLRPDIVRYLWEQAKGDGSSGFSGHPQSVNFHTYKDELYHSDDNDSESDTKIN